MANEIKGKKIKGFQYADGVHWYWGNREVAIINEETHEIEWCERKHNFPDEVVKEIRNLIPHANNQWLIEVRRTSKSVTQGDISIYINDKCVVTFNDDKEIIDGKWQSTIKDEDLGRLVLSAIYHPHDNLYHYSDTIKSSIYPKWNERKEER